MPIIDIKTGSPSIEEIEAKDAVYKLITHLRQSGFGNNTVPAILREVATECLIRAGNIEKEEKVEHNARIKALALEYLQAVAKVGKRKGRRSARCHSPFALTQGATRGSATPSPLSPYPSPSQSPPRATETP